jgi:alanyl-tRNA synthetase
VLENSPVTTRVMALDDARSSGARALFGEKYGDEVRVVAMGEGSGNTMGWSVELCGGTHVNRTGDIGLITVLSDAGVASGVRRIEALTGQAARANANTLARLAKATASELRVPVEDAPGRIAALLDDRKRLERELVESQQKLALSGGGARDSQPDLIVVNGTNLMIIQVKDMDPKNLKPLADQAKVKIGSGVVAVANTAADGKTSLVVSVTGDLLSRVSAADLVRKGAEALGGKGGGKPDMAQAGGSDASKVPAALDAIKAALS